MIVVHKTFVNNPNDQIDQISLLKWVGYTFEIPWRAEKILKATDFKNFISTFFIHSFEIKVVLASRAPCNVQLFDQCCQCQCQGRQNCTMSYKRSDNSPSLSSVLQCCGHIIPHTGVVRLLLQDVFKCVNISILVDLSVSLNDLWSCKVCVKEFWGLLY